jgi:hypothetical protein
MPKEWNDWSDLMKGKVGQPEDPRSKPVVTGPVLRKGEVPRRPSDAEIRGFILKDMPKQPTNQQLFGHLEVTEEMAKKAREEWESTFTKFFKSKHEPIEKNQKPDWGCRGPVDQNDPSQLTEEERRILNIPVNPKAY